ncbi:hypothetical protein ACIP69_18655 [Streptomyces hygroscopicus]|uniref:hypothetical protein n=1 Tax=Streptomyces hygroscopicus TaxID=1912 RepID=UPI0037FAC086
MTTVKSKGRCGICGNEYVLTKTGKVWPHKNGITSVVDPKRGQRCGGAGKPPADETKEK